MKKIILAAFLGGTLGVFTAVKLSGPVLAENNADKADAYEQLDLFGDIFDRIRSDYVEEVDARELIDELSVDIAAERIPASNNPLKPTGRY